jgi:hypothetical protein
LRFTPREKAMSVFQMVSPESTISLSRYPCSNHRTFAAPRRKSACEGLS